MNQQEIFILDKANEYMETMELYRKKYIRKTLKFSDIPLLEKQDLIEDQQLHPPFGSYLNTSIQNLARVHRTSGTSNAPLLLAVTSNDIENIRDTGCKAFLNAGLSADDIVINCMNYCMWMGGFMDHQSLEKTGATVIPYGVGHTENLIELICRIPNVCIHSTPSYLRRLEQVAWEKFCLKPWQLGIKKGFFGGEGGLQNREYRKRMEDIWHMDIYDANYGISEVMSIIASESRDKDGLVYVAGDIVYPELLIRESGVTSNDNIVPGAIGELILSNLKKEAQPLLRYVTGDIIEILERKEDNGICTDFKFRVIGRSDDMMVIKGINFYPLSLQNIISKYDGCTGNYKVIFDNSVENNNLQVLLETKKEQQHFIPLQKIQQEIRSKYFVSCQIILTDYIPADNNKVKLVERKGEN